LTAFILDADCQETLGMDAGIIALVGDETAAAYLIGKGCGFEVDRASFFYLHNGALATHPTGGVITWNSFNFANEVEACATPCVMTDPTVATCVGTCVAADAAGIGACVAAGGTYDDCVAASTAACMGQCGAEIAAATASCSASCGESILTEDVTACVYADENANTVPDSMEECLFADENANTVPDRMEECLFVDQLDEYTCTLLMQQYCGGLAQAACFAGFDDSDHDFNEMCLTDYDPSDCSGRLVFTHEPHCVAELQLREVYTDFVEVEVGDAPGDANMDGAINVLDVVAIVQYVLGNAELNVFEALNADANSDGSVDVLDVVSVVQTILAQGSRANNADSAIIHNLAGTVSIDANGFVGGVQMTLSHGDDFSINLTTDAMVADYNTVDNKTTLIIAAPKTHLFTAEGSFTIEEVLAATGNGYIDVSMDIPTAYSISSAYPNPFNPTTTIEFSASEAGYASVKVYNLMGQVVGVLMDSMVDAKTYNLTWNAKDLSSGVYMIQAESNGNVATQKVMLLK
jgi:hypothetical protein